MLLDISDFHLKLKCINICICQHLVLCAPLWIALWEKHFIFVLLQTQFFFFLHCSFKRKLVFYSHWLNFHFKLSKGTKTDLSGCCMYTVDPEDSGTFSEAL